MQLGAFCANSDELVLPQGSNCIFLVQIKKIQYLHKSKDINVSTNNSITNTHRHKLINLIFDIQHTMSYISTSQRRTIVSNNLKTVLIFHV